VSESGARGDETTTSNRQPPHISHGATYRIRKDFDKGRFGPFENLAQIGSVTIRGPLLRIGINAKGKAAATATKAEIAFGTGIKATAAAARGRVDNVLRRVRMIAQGKRGDANVAVFLNGAQVRPAALDKGFLPAAATLAAGDGTTKGTFDRQEFRFRVELLDFHDKAVIRRSSSSSSSRANA
jgi:hypothetical protein